MKVYAIKRNDGKWAYVNGKEWDWVAELTVWCLFDKQILEENPPPDDLKIIEFEIQEIGEVAQ